MGHLWYLSGELVEGMFYLFSPCQIYSESGKSNVSLVETREREIVPGNERDRDTRQKD